MIDIDGFKLYVYSIIPLSYTAVEICVYTLLCLELSVGVCLLFNLAPHLSSLVGIVLLVVFSAFLIWRISVGDNNNCHCFGDTIHLSPLPSLAKNIILLAILLPCVLFLPYQQKQFGIFISLFVVLSAFSCGMSMPDFMVPKQKESDIINSEKASQFIEDFGLENNNVFVSFVSPDCVYCIKYLSKLNTMLSRGTLEQTDILVVVMNDTHDSTDVEAFLQSNITDKNYSFKCMPPNLFLPIVKGAFPAGFLVSSGEIIDVVNLRNLTDLHWNSLRNPSQ